MLTPAGGGRWMLPLMLGVTILAKVSAQEVQSNYGPGDDVIVLPRPPKSMGTMAEGFVNSLPPYRQYTPTPPPASGADITGQCPAFYRQRPYGHYLKQRNIMIQNRASEPNWYRYYRCCHYGYYPTQWAEWPDGWDNCRYPQGPYEEPRAPQQRKPVAGGQPAPNQPEPAQQPPTPGKIELPKQNKPN